MNDDTPSRRKGTQFSLLTLLFVTAIVALSVTVTMLYRQLGPLRKEVISLRNEVGALSIEDPHKLHAIRVDTNSELEWKWRIWIPEGSSYRLRSSGGSIPAAGFPTDGGTMYLGEAGEQVIRYVIRRDPRDGRWIGSLHTRTGSVGGDGHPWVAWPSSASTGGGVGWSTESHATDQRVEIIRFRMSQANNSGDIEDPSAGFMVWLEPN